MFTSKRSDLFATAGAELTAQSYFQLTIAVCVKLSLVLGGLTGCASAPVQGQAPRSPTPASVNGIVQVQTIAKGLEHPWSLAILPDKRMLVTERRGRLRLVEADGRVSEPLAGVPQVYASGQGGLLDVVLSPEFETDRLVYLSFAGAGDGGEVPRSPAGGSASAGSKTPR